MIFFNFCFFSKLWSFRNENIIRLVEQEDVIFIFYNSMLSTWPDKKLELNTPRSWFVRRRSRYQEAAKNRYFFNDWNCDFRHQQQTYYHLLLDIEARRSGNSISVIILSMVVVLEQLVLPSSALSSTTLDVDWFCNDESHRCHGVVFGYLKLPGLDWLTRYLFRRVSTDSFKSGQNTTRGHWTWSRLVIEMGFSPLYSS